MTRQLLHECDRLTDTPEHDEQCPIHASFEARRRQRNPLTDRLDSDRVNP